MKMGVSKDELAPAFGRADEVFILQPSTLPWQVSDVTDACIQPAHWTGDVDMLVSMIANSAQPGITFW